MREVRAPDERVIDAAEDERALDAIDRSLARHRHGRCNPTIMAPADQARVGAGRANEAAEGQSLREKEGARLHHPESTRADPVLH